MIFPLIVFDAIPTSWLYDLIFDFSAIETDTAFNDQFNDVGYGSIFIVNNIGSMYLIMTIWIFMLILTTFLKKFRVFDRCEYLKKKINSYYQANFWNGIIDTCC
jgi:hypothetical protein